jgi:hypothetical protein
MFGNLCIFNSCVGWDCKNVKRTLLMDSTVRISHRLRIVRRTSSELSGRDSVLLLKGRASERRPSLLNLKADFILLRGRPSYPVLKWVLLDNVDMSTSLHDHGEYLTLCGDDSYVHDMLALAVADEIQGLGTSMEEIAPNFRYIAISSKR